MQAKTDDDVHQNWVALRRCIRAYYGVCRMPRGMEAKCIADAGPMHALVQSYFIPTKGMADLPPARVHKIMGMCARKIAEVALEHLDNVRGSTHAAREMLLECLRDTLEALATVLQAYADVEGDALAQVRQALEEDN